MNLRQLQMMLAHSDEQRIQALKDHHKALKACKNYNQFHESQKRRETKARLERWETITACLEAEVGTMV